VSGAAAPRGDAVRPPAQATPAAPLRALVEELVRAGVREVVVCPGSRSTPLALALAANPAIRTWVQLDERAGAFFALGMAKASRRAVAILATSGTAVVNFMPAVVEAREARVPLLVLTADRPPELRDRAAPQAIDQVHLYGRFAKWYAELPVPEDRPLLEAHLRGTVGRAVATAEAAPAGPVQLNLPFREPLIPDGPLTPAALAAGRDATASQVGAPFAEVLGGRRTLAAAELDRLAARIADARRGLIVCGPLDAPGFAAAITRLAAAAGYPILADGLSGVRFGRHDRSHVIGRHDAVTRAARFRAAHVPDLVIRFGGTPTSKALGQMLVAQAAPQVVVDDGGWTEATLLPVTMVQADPTDLAVALAERLEGRAGMPSDSGAPNAWLDGWLAADRAAAAAIADWLATLDEPFEGAAFAELDGRLPDGAIVVAGSSMPVRDLDAFLPASAAVIRCLGNRGANGIDGVVSTALGVAAVHHGPVVLVVGDLSFLHDLNALVAARLHGLPLTVVLVNNDGGGIFSFLPQAAAERPEVGLPERYEALFGTPHGVDPGPLATALGAEHARVTTGEIGPAVAASLGRPGVRVLEVRTDRARNVELHRACTAAVVAAVDALAVEAAGR
jgi:2-succinyl-5-enolpyruvyl-6-hydroxy-3-cyclohexene-1-carboxylate synthase